MLNEIEGLGTMASEEDRGVPYLQELSLATVDFPYQMSEDS